MNRLNDINRIARAGFPALQFKPAIRQGDSRSIISTGVIEIIYHARWSTRVPARSCIKFREENCATHPGSGCFQTLKIAGNTIRAHVAGIARVALP